MDDIAIVGLTITTCYLSYLFLLKKKTLRKRRFYRRPDNDDRHIFGFYEAGFLAIKQNAEEFFKFTRMTLPVFNILLNFLKSRLQKTKNCYTISPEARLAITLS